MNTHVLLPWHLAEFCRHRLCDKQYSQIILLQDYFDRPRNNTKNIHKLKLAWNMAICVEFAREKRIEIVDWDHVVGLSGTVSIFDPLDNELLDDFEALFKNRLTVIPLKNSFILDATDLQDVFTKMCSNDPTKRNISHAKFFKIVKEKTDTLVGVKSTDSENRRPLPSDGSLRPPDLPFLNKEKSKTGKTCASCMAFVDSKFASNPGSTEQLMHLPITRRDAMEYFDSFLKKKLSNYGAFQDAIDENSVELYHSHCSHLINAGLLTPKLVVSRVLAISSELGIRENNVEGFVRQVLGWREYMRFIYHFWGRELKSRMLALNRSNDSKYKRLDFDAWNRAETGIVPIDCEIRKVLRCAWSHHIVRLMIFMNFMKLNEIRPHDIYKWFMSMVSLDAYEWVMVANVMAMGYFDTRFMTRHYVSSSKYVLRMSNYKKDGYWDLLWDGLYKKYVAKHGVFGMQKYKE